MKITTAKPYRPNWKNIFSQLGNYFLTVKYNLLANKYTEAFLPLFSGYYCCLFLIVLRVHKTFLLKPNPQGKDLPRLSRPILVIY